MKFDVEVFIGSTSVSTITVEAETHEEASKKAFEVFTSDVHVTIKKNYG